MRHGKSAVRRQVIGALVAVCAVGSAQAVLGPVPAAQAAVIADAAQTKVTKKVPGKVLSVKKARRDGFTSWAVTVQRRDGSIVVGYVDVRSGIIFDWTVQRGPGGPVVDLDGPGGTLTPAKPPTLGPTVSDDATGGVTSPDSKTDPAVPSDEGAGPGPAPSGGGPVASPPGGGNPSMVYVGEVTDWDDSGWTDADWHAFFSWVWSLWSIDAPWSDGGGDADSGWQGDGESSPWVSVGPPSWQGGVGTDGVPSGHDWYDEESDWDGGDDGGSSGPDGSGGGTVWVGNGDDDSPGYGGSDQSDAGSDVPSVSGSEAPGDSDEG